MLVDACPVCLTALAMPPAAAKLNNHIDQIIARWPWTPVGTLRNDSHGDALDVSPQ
jgi:hypothetical protein